MLLHPSRANDYEGMPEPHPQASPVSGKIYAQRIPKKTEKRRCRTLREFGNLGRRFERLDLQSCDVKSSEERKRRLSY
jgi:hypothetical protein